MARAAPTVSSRFLGFTDVKSRARPAARARAERVDPRRPGRRVRRPRHRSGAPATDARRGPAAARRRGASPRRPTSAGSLPASASAPSATASTIAPTTPRPRTHAPANAQALRVPFGVGEHQHHGHDRERAQRHADPEREHLADGVTRGHRAMVGALDRGPRRLEASARAPPPPPRRRRRRSPSPRSGSTAPVASAKVTCPLDAKSSASGQVQWAFSQFGPPVGRHPGLTKSYTHGRGTWLGSRARGWVCHQDMGGGQPTRHVVHARHREPVEAQRMVTRLGKLGVEITLPLIVSEDRRRRRARSAPARASRCSRATTTSTSHAACCASTPAAASTTTPIATRR